MKTIIYLILLAYFFTGSMSTTAFLSSIKYGDTAVVPELLRTLVFARPCGGDQFAAGTVSPSLDMSR